MIPSEKLTIETPEHVALEFNLAGVGSRFLAFVYDTLIQIIVYTVLIVAFVLIVPNLDRYWESANKWTVAAFILIFFVLYWGYFAIFEALWNGQTPGKKKAGIRVIKNSGRPIGAFEAMARNFLRTVDYLPAFGGVGLIAIFLSRRNCRLGDMVAGTVVVHESPPETTAPIFVEQKLQQLSPTFDVGKLSARELELIETFQQRKLDLAPEVRQATAHKIAGHIAGMMELPKEAIGYDAGQWRPEQFLEQIALDLRSVGRYRG